MVTTDSGAKLMEAPEIFVGPAGTQRVGYALTDVVWLNVHGSTETDPEKLEKELTVESVSELEQVTWVG